MWIRVLTAAACLTVLAACDQAQKTASIMPQPPAVAPEIVAQNCATSVKSSLYGYDEKTASPAEKNAAQTAATRLCTCAQNTVTPEDWQWINQIFELSKPDQPQAVRRYRQTAFEIAISTMHEDARELYEMRSSTIGSVIRSECPDPQDLFRTLRSEARAAEATTTPPAAEYPTAPAPYTTP